MTKIPFDSTSHVVFWSEMFGCLLNVRRTFFYPFHCFVNHWGRLDITKK